MCWNINNVSEKSINVCGILGRPSHLEHLEQKWLLSFQKGCDAVRLGTAQKLICLLDLSVMLFTCISSSRQLDCVDFGSNMGDSTGTPVLSLRFHSKCFKWNIQQHAGTQSNQASVSWWQIVLCYYERSYMLFDPSLTGLTSVFAWMVQIRGAKWKMNLNLLFLFIFHYSC